MTIMVGRPVRLFMDHETCQTIQLDREYIQPTGVRVTCLLQADQIGLPYQRSITLPVAQQMTDGALLPARASRLPAVTQGQTALGSVKYPKGEWKKNPNDTQKTILSDVNASRRWDHAHNAPTLFRIALSWEHLSLWQT